MTSPLPLLLLGLFAIAFLPSLVSAQSSCLPCIADDDCVHGQCVNGTCVCNERYDHKGDTGCCTYKRKARLTAFLLSFFLGGWGADRFYLLYGGLGALKLILGLLSCCLCYPLIGFTKKTGKGPLTIFLGVLQCLLCTGFYFGWCLSDLIRIGTGDLEDRRGHRTWDNL